jgi:Spy/CpxP family protein refolding chaperone
MKKNWLLSMVIFSLALNFGTIGALIYFRLLEKPALSHMARPPEGGLRKLIHSLDLDEQQKQALQPRFPQHLLETMELRRQLAQERVQLFQLLQAEQPDEALISAKLKEISEQQNNLENRMVSFILDTKKILRPDQQEQLLQRVGQRLCGPGFCGAPNPEHRRGRGRCGPRMGPPEPPER